jgi:hypothetical protein
MIRCVRCPASPPDVADHQFNLSMRFFPKRCSRRPRGSAATELHHGAENDDAHVGAKSERLGRQIARRGTERKSTKNGYSVEKFASEGDDGMDRKRSFSAVSGRERCRQCHPERRCADM